MAFIPVPNVAEVQLVYSCFGITVENTLYFDMGAAISITDLVTLAGRVKTWWDTNMKPLIWVSCALERIIATALDSESASSINYVTGLPVTGTLAGSCLPLNATLATEFITLLRGRSYRGRNYWPVLLEAEVVNNNVDASKVAAIHAAYAALITASTGWTTPWGVVSRYHANAPRVTGLINPITAVAGDSSVDSQRRRLNGRGI